MGTHRQLYVDGFSETYRRRGEMGILCSLCYIEMENVTSEHLPSGSWMGMGRQLYGNGANEPPLTLTERNVI